MESVEFRCGPRICAEFYYRRGEKFPSVEGWRALRDGVVIVPHPPSCSARHPPPRTTHANYVCAGAGGRWAFGCTLSPVIAKEYANVENVGVRLWQSSAICLRAFARSAFYLLDRHALLAMTMGSKCFFLKSLTIVAPPPAKGGGH